MRPMTPQLKSQQPQGGIGMRQIEIPKQKMPKTQNNHIAVKQQRRGMKNTPPTHSRNRNANNENKCHKSTTPSETSMRTNNSKQVQPKMCSVLRVNCSNPNACSPKQTTRKHTTTNGKMSQTHATSIEASTKASGQCFAEPK